MQPDYCQLWRQLNDGQPQDTPFYIFFEDNLNQFISVNAAKSNEQLSNKVDKENKTNAR